MNETPRCRMCSRPASWSALLGTFRTYCSGSACTNQDRICQRCEAPFRINRNGANHKYCSAECIGVRVISGGTRRWGNSCAWCNKPGARRPQNNSAWPYVCQECLGPIKHVAHLFKDHHVPHERAREFAANPQCAICQRDLLEKMPDRYSGKLRNALVIDHDHSCCPTGASCGECARGPLCNRCNQGIGLFLEDPAHLESAIQYLKNPPWKSS